MKNASFNVHNLKFSQYHEDLLWFYFYIKSRWELSVPICSVSFQSQSFISAHLLDILQIEKSYQISFWQKIDGFFKSVWHGVRTEAWLETVLSSRVLIYVMNGSQSLFDIVRKICWSQEKRRMIYFHTANEAYELFELNDVVLVRFQFNIADALSKMKRYSVLTEIITSGKLDHLSEQWTTFEK